MDELELRSCSLTFRQENLRKALALRAKHKSECDRISACKRYRIALRKQFMIHDDGRICHAVCGDACEDIVSYSFHEGDCRPFMIEPNTETWHYEIRCVRCELLLYSARYGTSITLSHGRKCLVAEFG